MKLGTTITLATLSLVLCSAANAQIVKYDLTGAPSSTPPVTYGATTVATGLTASPLSRGPDIVASGLANAFSSSSWNTAATTSTNIQTATLANAIARGEYYEFSVAVEPNYRASFSTMDLSLRRSGATAPMNYQWQYSTDGFATAGTGFADFNYWGRSSGTAPATVVPYSWMTGDVAGQNNGNPITQIDLSTVAAFQNIEGGTTITFRLYAWGNDATPGTDSNTIGLGRYNGPAIGGTVSVVPEPAAAALLGLGLLALVSRRNR